MNIAVISLLNETCLILNALYYTNATFIEEVALGINPEAEVVLFPSTKAVQEARTIPVAELVSIERYVKSDSWYEERKSLLKELSLVGIPVTETPTAL